MLPLQCRKAFWTITAFLCAGFGGLGLVIGLFAATLQVRTLGHINHLA